MLEFLVVACTVFFLKITANCLHFSVSFLMHVNTVYDKHVEFFDTKKLPETPKGLPHESVWY